MLKEHPRGLFVAFFTHMGEKFDFYAMMAILVFFFQAKYGLSEGRAGSIYSTRISRPHARSVATCDRFWK